MTGGPSAIRRRAVRLSKKNFRQPEQVFKTLKNVLKTYD